MKKILLSVVAMLAASSGASELPKENRFDFQKRLLCVHRADRRDAAVRPREGDFVFADGAVVAIAPGADAVLAHAADDFADYLKVSMRLKDCRVEATGRLGSVSVGVDSRIPERASRIVVAKYGVTVAGHDSVAAMQALYHLEDLMNLRRGPYLACGTENRRARYATRMIHSGYAKDAFPDAYLDQLAHAGFESVLFYVTAAPKKELADVIDRAAARGLKTWLYNSARAAVHPDDPNAAAVFERNFAPIAKAYAKAEGMIFVGESCPFPSKDPRVCPPGVPREIRETKYAGKVPATCFPCSDYPDWLDAVKGVLHRYAPKMKTVMWSYNWGGQDREARMALIDRLDVADTPLLVTFEMLGRHRKRNGFMSPAADYTLAFEGPGEYFVSEAERAKRRGLTLFAMTNTGGRTWDFGGIPYLPCPYQWKRRWDAINAAHDRWNLSGLMESHHYGWTPSFVSELCKEAFTEGGIPFDEHVRLIAARDFGEENDERVLAVWRDWSDAIRDYVPSAGNQYGAFRIGPAYPYNFGGRHIAKKLCFCHPNYVEKIRGWYMYDETIFDEVALLRDAVRKFADGGRTLAAIAAALPAERAESALRVANLGEYVGCWMQTGLNVKDGAIAWYRGDQRTVREIAARERANATAAIAFADRDSQLGYEPAMGYCADRERIEWKLALMDEAYGAKAVSPLDELKPAPKRIARDPDHTASADSPVRVVRGGVAGGGECELCIAVGGVTITAPGEAGERKARETLERLKAICLNYGYRLPCCTIAE